MYDNLKNELIEMLKVRLVTFISPVFSICFANVDFEIEHDFVFERDFLRVILFNRENEYLAVIKLTQEQIDSLTFNYDLNYISLH